MTGRHLTPTEIKDRLKRSLQAPGKAITLSPENHFKASVMIRSRFRKRFISESDVEHAWEQFLQDLPPYENPVATKEHS